MALEIVGSRLLQPTFGSSIDVWAAIISIFILSLSAGYFLGGHLADRTRGLGVLALTILTAGALYLLLPISPENSADRTLYQQLQKRFQGPLEPGVYRLVARDKGLITAASELARKRYSRPLPTGWARTGHALDLIYWETDWALLARGTFRQGVEMVRKMLLHQLGSSWTPSDAPLFTDEIPNADIMNR